MTIPFLSAALAFAEIVPSLAKWLSGHKAEAVADQVVSVARRITGVQDPTQALKVLRENSLMLLDFQRAMIQMEADLDLHFLKDRQDARMRDIHLFKTPQHNYRGDVMVVTAAIGLVLCLMTLTLYAEALPGEAVGIISTIAGIFGACLKDAYAFEFGSSRESKEKDLALNQLIEKSLK